jgi:predicted ATPase/DNA-binding CsgD family transcriptional regulator
MSSDPATRQRDAGPSITGGGTTAAKLTVCTAMPDTSSVTAVERSAVADGLGARHGFPAELTSFVGRAEVVAEVAAHLTRYRLVTLTGPGGAGKTRLAGQVANQAATLFADGVWLAELAAVSDSSQVASTVGAALGIRDLPAEAAADALARALARRQLLLVLDNCEHVIGAAAEVCARLLLAADDVRILATSREPLRIAGEARYRLGPLALPSSGDLTAAAESEAVMLFADRARRAEPGFTLDADTVTTVARLVSRLDGLPLAIELAAARVDVLGVTQLLDRINDRFSLLADADRLAEDRQRSLASALRWSYQLLGATEQRVFRALAAFPGPFTLDAAGAVTKADAGRVVLRLVDCSLVLPPRTGPDGRSRYAMLETLRAYAGGLLAQAGEEAEVSAALAAYAAEMSTEAAAAMGTCGREVEGLRQLDAEDVTVHHALAWALEHDPPGALKLALTLAPWWQLRGRLSSQAPLLAAAAEHVQAGTDAWCAARLLLGQVVGEVEDPPAMLAHFTAAADALKDRHGPLARWEQGLLSTCLAARASALLRMGRVAEAVQDGRRAVCLAQEAGGGAIEALALGSLTQAIRQNGDRDSALRLARQAQLIAEGHAGVLFRGLGEIVAGVLIEAGELAAAERACTTALASCRQVGDQINLCGVLGDLTILDLRTGRTGAAAAHLRELLQVATQTGRRSLVHLGLDCCGYLSSATGRPAEAITAWAAMSALRGPWPPLPGSLNPARRDMLRRRAQHLLGKAAAQAAQERGAAMSLATATEYALLLAAGPPAPAEDGPASVVTSTTAKGLTGLGELSPRERELVTLVARGRTDAQIAAELFITVRTVGTHLDRIRDKTGCRRRADLTRLALTAGLV